MSDASSKDETKQSQKWLGGIAGLVLVIAVLATLHNRAQDRVAVQYKLARVQFAIDPVKSALDTAYNRDHTLPVVATVVTAANQGKDVTPGWAVLGFKTLPKLPPEVGSLRVTPEGDIVVAMIRIGDGIDGTTLRVSARREGSHSKWVYNCTSTDDMVRRQFNCVED